MLFFKGKKKHDSRYLTFQLTHRLLQPDLRPLTSSSSNKGYCFVGGTFSCYCHLLPKFKTVFHILTYFNGFFHEKHNMSNISCISNTKAILGSECYDHDRAQRGNSHRGTQHPCILTVL